MSEYDELLDDVLTERDVSPETGAEDLVASRPDRTSDKATAKGTRSVSTSKAKRVSKPRREAPKQAKVVPTYNDPSPEPARRGMNRLLERTGRCPMYAPRGTTCKTCGKVHPI